MTGARRWLLVGALVVIAVAGFAIAKSGDDDGGKRAVESAGSKTGTKGGAPARTPEIPVVTVRVAHGEPVGGVRKIEVKKGDRVRLRVASDVADEVHIHGYDLMKDVDAGGTVSFDFRAKDDGVYEIELEDRATQIAKLRVEP
ncbi:MAG TPA: hypothetical protein VF545_03570 [Thermoleophilaceae bacterium]|jgi:FtsP/CotA-like multicopper oxidase with cupredoxin domain